LAVLKYPQQILDLFCRIRFTQQCEKILANGDTTTVKAKLEAFKVELVEELHHYTSFDVGSINDVALRNVVHLRLKSLILDAIYFQDVVEQLISESASSTSAWTWERQLRFYPSAKGVEICCGDARFQYTFEYQGNPSKLVHTPLTDKCYLTLTQAMNDGFGGCPFGPAGYF
jgi:dynein heavy chain 2